MRCNQVYINIIFFTMEENTQERLRKYCLISYDNGRLLTGRQTNRLHGLVELLEKDENTATFEKDVLF